MRHNKKKLNLLALTLTTTLGIGAPSLMIDADFAIGSTSDGEWIIGVASDDDMKNQMIKKEEDPMMRKAKEVIRQLVKEEFAYQRANLKGPEDEQGKPNDF